MGVTINLTPIVFDCISCERYLLWKFKLVQHDVWCVTFPFFPRWNFLTDIRYGMRFFCCCYYLLLRCWDYLRMYSGSVAFLVLTIRCSYVWLRHPANRLQLALLVLNMLLLVIFSFIWSITKQTFKCYEAGLSNKCHGLKVWYSTSWHHHFVFCNFCKHKSTICYV